MRLMEGLAGVLARLASKRQPIIHILDDMHEVDASSWQALAYLARVLAAIPVVVVCVARPGEFAEHKVGGSVVLSLEQEDLMERIALGPLDRDELSSLARSVLGEEPSGTLLGWLGN